MLKRFRNKKIATLIIAFVMIFVMAGAFAAFQRLLLLNARVNLFAPMVEVVWTNASVETPPLWSPLNPRGLGVPSAGARFAERTWPAVATVAEDLVQWMSPSGNVAETSAWWHLSHEGTDQHALPGQFPGPMTISQMSLAEPVEYIELLVGMVFDNVDQTYTWTLTMGNPSTVPLETTGVNVTGLWVDDFIDWTRDPDTGRVTGFTPGTAAELRPDSAAPHNTIVDVDFDGLVGHVIQPGQTAVGTIVFSAPETNWVNYFNTTDGEYFLDNFFEDDIPAFYAIEVVTSIATS